MKIENKTILLYGIYVAPGLICFVITLMIGVKLINVYPELGYLNRLIMLLGIVIGILIIVVSILFGKFTGMLYKRVNKTNGVDMKHEENDMDI